MVTKLNLIVYAWIIANGALLIVEAQRCPANYVEMSGRCIRVVATDMHRSAAEQFCRASGGRLASVLTSNDPVMTAVRQITQATRVWIGLKKTRTDWQYASVSGSDRFIQRQGCYLDSYSATEFNELAGIRNNYTATACMQECRARARQYAGIMRWNRPGVSLPLECRCSTRFTSDHSKITPCNWPCPSNSSVYCASHFNDQNSRTARNSLLVFRLLNAYSSFDAWRFGQPDNSYHSNRIPYQSCNSLDIADRTNFGWNDGHCAATSFSDRNQQRQYGYLCQYDVPSQAQCRTQSSGRIYMANKCIRADPNRGQTWFEARQNCLADGGDLLRIDNANLLNTLSEWLSNWIQSPSRWWIDGINEEWTWPDGRKLGRYTNWMSSKPATEINMCAVLVLHQSSWQWTDENCNVAHPSICETDLLTVTTSTSTTSTSTSTTTTKQSTTINNRPTSTPARSTTTTMRVHPATTTSSRSTSTTTRSSLPTVASRATVLTTPGLPTTRITVETTDDSALNTTITSMELKQRPDLTNGVIISLVVTVLIVVITTARMLISCRWDKIQRDDALN